MVGRHCSLVPLHDADPTSNTATTIATYVSLKKFTLRTSSQNFCYDWIISKVNLTKADISVFESA